MQSYCDICWVILLTQTEKEDHFNSKDHLFNLNQLSAHANVESEKFCKLCLQEVSDNQQHLKSKNHLKKHFEKYYVLDFIKKFENKLDIISDYNLEPLIRNRLAKSNTFVGNLSTIEQTPTLKKSKSTFFNKFNEETSCSICYIEFTSQQHKEQHFNGQIHKKRVEVANKIENSNRESLINCCEVCYLIMPPNSNSQFSEHMNSEKHKKSVELKSLFESQFKGYSQTNNESALANEISSTVVAEDASNSEDENETIDYDKKWRLQNVGKVCCVEFKVESNIYNKSSYMDIVTKMEVKWSELKKKFDFLVENLIN